MPSERHVRAGLRQARVGAFGGPDEEMVAGGQHGKAIRPDDPAAHSDQRVQETAPVHWWVMHIEQTVGELAGHLRASRDSVARRVPATPPALVVPWTGARRSSSFAGSSAFAIFM